MSSFDQKTTAEEVAQAFKGQITGKNGEFENATTWLTSISNSFCSLFHGSTHHRSLSGWFRSRNSPSSCLSGSKPLDLHWTNWSQSSKSLQVDPIRDSLCKSSFYLFGSSFSRVLQSSFQGGSGILRAPWHFDRKRRHNVSMARVDNYRSAFQWHTPLLCLLTGRFQKLELRTDSKCNLVLITWDTSTSSTP